MTEHTIETILREQVRMWKRLAHIFGAALVIMCFAVIALALANLS